MRPRIEELLPAIPFGIAEYNFYRAAQHGLDARLVWPGFEQSGFAEQSICSIIAELLPLARQGLDAIGVSASESSRYLGVIEQRLARRQTGAIWQQRTLAKLRQRLPLEASLHELLEEFIRHSMDNRPVAEWPL